MAIATDRELVPEAIIDKDGLKVSASPWGPDDEIGRLNWITPDTNAAILDPLDGRHVFDLNVEYFIGMPSWVAAGDPPIRRSLREAMARARARTGVVPDARDALCPGALASRGTRRSG